MPTRYDQDIVEWANEQVRFLRARQFDRLDIEHIAEEIEDVGKSEQRELASRMAVLLAHLLKWQYQSGRRGSSWRRTIQEQRKAIVRRLKKTPSLTLSINDNDWWEDVWGDAVIQAEQETGLDYPETCPWTLDQIIASDFFPEE